MDNFIHTINVNNTKYPISSSKMNNIDTQYKENNPQWYITNYSNSVVSETNKNTSVKSPFNGTYCTITTYIPSNGYPKQIILDSTTNKMAIRVGTSNTEWSKWTNYYTKDEIDSINSSTTSSIEKYIKDNTIPRTSGTNGQFALSDGNGGIRFETLVNMAEVGL